MIMTLNLEMQKNSFHEGNPASNLASDLKGERWNTHVSV